MTGQMSAGYSARNQCGLPTQFPPYQGLNAETTANNKARGGAPIRPRPRD
jgi:hypothetical protein